MMFQWEITNSCMMFQDLFFTMTFFYKMGALLGPVLGGWGTVGMFLFVR